MKIQFIEVSTKKGLLAALECAKFSEDQSNVDYTHITLMRKTGKTYFTYNANANVKVINRAKRLTRGISAKDLLN